MVLDCQSLQIHLFCRQKNKKKKSEMPLFYAEVINSCEEFFRV